MLNFSQNSSLYRSYTLFGWVAIVTIIFLATQLYGRTIFQGLAVTVIRTSIAVVYWHYLKKYFVNNHVRNHKLRFTINMRSLVLPVLALLPAIAQVVLNILFYYFLDSWIFDMDAESTQTGISRLPFSLEANTHIEYFLYSLIFWWIFFVIWGGYHVFIGYWIPYSYREPLYLQTTRLAREIELRNLESQINSDFLFDTLHSLASDVGHNPERVKLITLSLTDYLRFSLNHSQENTSLGEELKAVSGRLRIEQFLRDQACTYQIQIEPSHIQEIEISTPLILPLIDYLFHSQSTPIPEFPIDIQIRITNEHEFLQIAVSNQKTPTVKSTLCPIPPELESLARKLNLVYGENYQLNILKHDLEQTTVTLRVSLPYPHLPRLQRTTTRNPLIINQST